MNPAKAPELQIDHLVVAAETLAEGVTWVETRLGVTMAPGGVHPAMGTHNRLLSLGNIYLEVIAIDPAAPTPDRARWFGLDSFRGPPRLTTWVARSTDLAAALALAPPGSGTPMQLSRGDLAWAISVTDSGTMPFNNAFPALIQWHGTAHPAARLPDAGCTLASLHIGSPDATALCAALKPYAGGLADLVNDTPHGFSATITTPSGPRTLP